MKTLLFIVVALVILALFAAAVLRKKSGAGKLDGPWASLTAWRIEGQRGGRSFDR